MPHRLRRVLPLVGLLLLGVARMRAQPTSSPDRLYQELFTDVQRAKVFPDQKTFCDCVGKEAPELILGEYRKEKNEERGSFDLEHFIVAHFLLPQSPAVSVPPEPTLSAHLTELWTLLSRQADRAVPHSSLLALPHPYVVPGGRFREVYYWDSYFTMLGLRESGREDLIRGMVGNFAYEVEAFGHIPNGNRSYYLSRSQPPFFALMVELLAQKDPSAYLTYHAALQAEYAYWMNDSKAEGHVVHLPDGTVLNRYRDEENSPRPEAFLADEQLARASPAPAPVLYRNVRSAAESGWDFSTRWFSDGKTLGTIHTTDLIPVDLNCLLDQLELTLAKSDAAVGDLSGESSLRAAASRRRTAIIATFWSRKNGYFFDYDLKRGQQSPAWTLAGVTPLFLGLATPAQAEAVAAVIQDKFLRAGGVVTSLERSGQQWDAPNGWAPLEWMTIQGLRNYGQEAMAADIAHRWVRLNRQVYERTGKMMEKYNVEDTKLPGGGGEYPSQDGFGWTNGVLLALLRLYPEN